MDTKKELKVYTIEFRPMVNKVLKDSRRILFVAYSDKQAKKFFFDWRHNVVKHECIFEGIWENKPEKDVHPDDWKEELKKHFKSQSELIYKKKNKNAEEKKDN